jgi:ribosomal protein S18 acetylase RimI-like enzyme
MGQSIRVPSRSVRKAVARLVGGRVAVVVRYRGFRNDDPPRLALIWNEAFTGRGEVHLRHSSPLDNYVFAKPYFDPAGLIVAEENGAPAGFVHAGFGANNSGSSVLPLAGVICLLGVRPTFRRRGIGRDLLLRAEAYLREGGARSLFAGPRAPLNPFYFGLYGGSEMPGFLESDAAAAPFLARQGYSPHDTTLVLQRPLHQPINIVDARFATLRRRYELRIVPHSGIDSWWQECVLGPIELVEFRLFDKTLSQVAAQTLVWEMDLFSWRWNQPAVGILDIQVREELRRQGLAKLLLAQMLRYLQEQFFGLVEVQTVPDNPLAIKLFQSAGFEQVDTGHVYKKQVSGES